MIWLSRRDEIAHALVLTQSFGNGSGAYLIKIILLANRGRYIALRIGVIMFIPSVRIDRDAYVSDLVKLDYRTAAVFRKYGIEFCCSGRFPLSLVCENKGLDTELLIAELKDVTRPLQQQVSLNFADWDIDFLTDYILHVHHRYLRDRLPFIKEEMERFVEEHRRKYPDLVELQDRFEALRIQMYPHLQQEEEVLFPYVRQIAHAYADNEPYAGLLVRTLRKPVEDMMKQEHDHIMESLVRMRQLSANYTPPESACVSHRLNFSLLRELDNDLAQHFYLENKILFPRAIAMENELLKG